MKVYKFIQNNTDKIILATDDVHQLELIEVVSNVKRYGEYINLVLILFSVWNSFERK